MQMLKKRGGLSALAVLFSLAATASYAQSDGDADKCAALANHRIDGGFVTSAQIIAASDKLPAYCEVRATALPAISSKPACLSRAGTASFIRSDVAAGAAFLGAAMPVAGGSTRWLQVWQRAMQRPLQTAAIMDFRWWTVPGQKATAMQNATGDGAPSVRPIACRRI